MEPSLIRPYFAQRRQGWEDTESTWFDSIKPTCWVVIQAKYPLDDMVVTETDCRLHDPFCRRLQSLFRHLLNNTFCEGAHGCSTRDFNGASMRCCWGERLSRSRSILTHTCRWYPCRAAPDGPRLGNAAEDTPATSIDDSCKATVPAKAGRKTPPDGTANCL